MTYAAPVRDYFFAATELAGLERITALPGMQDANAELLQSVLEEAAKFGGEVLAPLNHAGDREGVKLQGGRVITPQGWREAYAQFTAGGWNSLPFDPARGGQGLPWVMASAVLEIWHAANMAFALCPLLTQSAIEALEAHATDEQKDLFLDKMISGEWAGTMNLTEPQAGSDLSAVRTKAEPQGDHYLLRGQKIFITYGDHDLTDNIIHLVLARTPDAPEGVKGISLFIVPKFLRDENGEWKKPNEVEAVSLEEKLGIHACPTAVLSYGAKRGAVGYLVGEENRGLIYMFTMMNLARHAVGVQANGVAERAYQQAAAFANERTQGRAIEAPEGGRVTLIQHPDVRRMLWLQKSRIEALRSLALVNAAALDMLAHADAGDEKTAAEELVEVLIPIIKGYTTEVGLENVSLALQVHGGMGFIEETGAAQHYRDQRITPIYEGTTGIQAMDLVGRKLMRDDGAMTARVIARIRDKVTGLVAANADTELQAMQTRVLDALDKLAAAAKRIKAAGREDARVAGALGEPYLRLWGVTACGWQMLHAACAAAALQKENPNDDFYANKIKTARFYFAAEMPKVDYLCEMIRTSGDVVATAEAGLFAGE